MATAYCMKCRKKVEIKTLNRLYSKITGRQWKVFALFVAQRYSG